jgi:Ca2+-binding RTX toxin-like protein
LGRGGNDTLTGGNGGDSFVFNNITEGIDTITDFGGGDRIEISASGFGGNLTANAVLDQSQFVLGSAASNINHRFIYNNSTGDLFFDPDGIGTIAQQKLAILTGAPSLSAIDIFVFT